MKSSARANGANGSAAPIATQTSVVDEQGRRGPAAEERYAPRADHEDDEGLGRERLDEPAGMKERRARVEDEQHHAERREIEERADRAEDDHEAADRRRCPRLSGRCEQLLVDVVGRDRHLADVVEQVVQQDLRREHRQEREEQRRAGGAEHVAEVRRRAHQHVLDRVGEDAPAFDDAVGEDRRDPYRAARCRPRPWRRRVPSSTEMPTSASCSASASLTPSPRKPTSLPSVRCSADDARFLLGRDASEDRRLRQRGGERRRRRARRICAPVSTPATARPSSRQTLAATRSLSPVTIFTSMPRRASRARLSAASAFAGSAKARKPRSRDRVRRSTCDRSEFVGAARAATATTRLRRRRARRARARRLRPGRWCSARRPTRARLS